MTALNLPRPARLRASSIMEGRSRIAVRTFSSPWRGIRDI